MIKNKKQLTELQFQSVIQTMNIGDQTRSIAWGVLVEGKSQKYFAERLGITKGAVNQAVGRVWNAFINLNQVPDGFEKITVVLPLRQAFIVKKWENDAGKLQ